MFVFLQRTFSFILKEKLLNNIAGRRLLARSDDERRGALWELVIAERSYVHNLSCIVTAYKHKMGPELLSREDRKLIFSNVEDILAVHFELWDELEVALKKWPSISVANLFLAKVLLCSSVYNIVNLLIH